MVTNKKLHTKTEATAKRYSIALGISFIFSINLIQSVNITSIRDVFANHPFLQSLNPSQVSNLTCLMDKIGEALSTGEDIREILIGLSSPETASSTLELFKHSSSKEKKEETNKRILECWNLSPTAAAGASMAFKTFSTQQFALLRSFFQDVTQISHPTNKRIKITEKAGIVF